MTYVAELAGLAASRSKTWWFLSRFYLERPEPPFLRELENLLDEAIDHDQGDAVELTSLRDGLPKKSSEARELNAEYTRLFRGIKEGHGPPPPFESIYRGEQLLGETTAAVLRSFQAAGFEAIEPDAGPQDHLGVELRFLSLLCLREHEGWESNDPDTALSRIAQQRDFLDRHLLTWLPDHAGRITNESRTQFYRAVAQLTLRFARETRSLLDAIEVEVPGPIFGHEPSAPANA